MVLNRSHVMALGDQVLSSATGLLLLVTVGYVGSANELGGIALLTLCQAITLGLSRTALGDALVMSRSIVASGAESALSFAPKALVVGLMGGMLVSIVGYVGGVDWWLVLAVAIMQPFLCLQDLARYSLLTSNQTSRAFAIDLSWLLVMVSLTMGIGYLGGNLVLAVTVANTMGCLTSCLFAWGAPHKSHRASRLLSNASAERVRLFGIEYFAGPGAIQFATLAITPLLGLAQLGLLRLSISLVAPVVTVVAVLRVVALSQLADGRTRVALRTAVRLGAGLSAAVVLGGVTVCVALIFLPELGSVADATLVPVVLVACVFDAARMMWQPQADVLRSRGRSRTIILVRGTSTAVLVVTLWAGAIGERAVSVLAIGSVGHLTVLALYWGTNLRALRAESRAQAEISAL